MSARNSQTSGVLIEPFDVPADKKIVDFGPSPYYANTSTAPRAKLSCYFYLTFIVKEYDEGEKGAEWLAIAPIGDMKAPECSRSHVPSEKVIEGREWSGYFKGARGNLVFFTGDDGYNGGMPFAVYDSRTGKKLFDDVAYDSSFVNKGVPDSPFNRLRVSGPHDSPRLSYLRVIATDCDLHREGATCWETIKKQFGLSGPGPVCSGYSGINTPYPSVVAYPVEVSLFPEPSTKTEVGPIRCWPVD